MQRLEVSCAVRSLYGWLGVKELNPYTTNIQNFHTVLYRRTVEAFKFVWPWTILHKKFCILLTSTFPPVRRIFLTLPPESREIVVNNIKWKIDLIDDGSVGLNVQGGHFTGVTDNSQNLMTQWVTVVTVPRWSRWFGSALTDLACDLRTANVAIT